LNTIPSEVREIQKKATLTLEAGRSLINRSYLAELEQYPVQAFAQADLPLIHASDLRLFRIERIVQDNKQSVLESTTAAYTALGASGYSVFLFLRSDGIETDLYIGTRGEPGQSLGQSSGELLRETFKGHFSGSSLLDLKANEVGTVIEGLLAEKANPSASITAVTGVPALSTENREHFMQGLERFIDAAERRKYQAIILAEPVSLQNLDLIRSGYEQVATQLSPLLKQQLSFGQQESDSVGLSISQSLSESLGSSLGLTETRGNSYTIGTSTTETSGTSSSTSKSMSNSVSPNASFAPFGVGFGMSNSTSVGVSTTTGASYSRAEGSNESHGTSNSESVAKTASTTHTAGATDTHSLNRTTGANRQVSIEFIDKSIEQLLGKIDHHLKRIDEAKTYGGWNSAAYFIGDSTASSEALASIFLGLVRGSNSSHEDFALTTWNSTKKSAVLDWLGTFSHPWLKPPFSKNIPIRYLTPATLVSGKELAIQLSLPRRSTSTVAVVTTQAYGRKVQRSDGNLAQDEKKDNLILGRIRHLWENLPQEVKISRDQLSSHVFVCGSTGSGKSNTLYEMLSQINASGIPFLVIEPAKGEYKHVFGHESNVRVFGTNPAQSELLRINPFCFPTAIHVLEHVDRLVEIFNVCWPMYAAMPAVLKKAILQAYQQCGWDLDHSTNQYSDRLYPSFRDLLFTLEQVIESSAYSQELKGNYIGSLSTRIKSLTNGLNGQIFSPNEIDSKVLFDSSVIVDLSRVGSSETKALIMGILVMRLSEYRMAQGGMNKPLQHVTVLEEAHNILRRSPSEIGAEGAGLMSKSVEMLTNAIAEMRTYGEGFIIVDQSPHAVDVAAIRNTNTKIIMRLPDEMDRRLIGKSVALRDDQLDEIARLPKGVAIVYQNDWLEPVLCQVNKYNGTEYPYNYQPVHSANVDHKAFNQLALNFLLAHRICSSADVDLALLEKGLCELPLRAPIKIAILQAINSSKRNEPSTITQPQAFALISQLVVDLLDCRNSVQKVIRLSDNFEQLCEQLNAVISGYVSGLSNEMVLAIQHCLMKDYSLQCDNHVGIYSAWRTTVESRMVL
jgi:hypothetical protein